MGLRVPDKLDFLESRNFIFQTLVICIPSSQSLPISTQVLLFTRYFSKANFNSLNNFSLILNRNTLQNQVYCTLYFILVHINTITTKKSKCPSMDHVKLCHVLHTTTMQSISITQSIQRYQLNFQLIFVWYRVVTAVFDPHFICQLKPYIFQEAPPPSLG